MRLRESMQLTIKEWNVWFPFDCIWRKKYNIPFRSEQHLNTSFFSMIYDLREEETLKEFFDQLKEKEGTVIESYIDEGGKRKEIIDMTDKQIDNEFDNLDLSKY